jgi:hypothetical protein
MESWFLIQRRNIQCTVPWIVAIRLDALLHGDFSALHLTLHLRSITQLVLNSWFFYKKHLDGLALSVSLGLQRLAQVLLALAWLIIQVTDHGRGDGLKR